MATQPLELRGRILRGQELREYAEKHGVCTICGVYPTHRRVGRFFSKLEPITVVNDDGLTMVYKGYCTQPTCYTLQQVKEILGESSPKHASHLSPGRSRLRRESGWSSNPSLPSPPAELTVSSHSSSHASAPHEASATKPSRSRPTSPRRDVSNGPLAGSKDPQHSGWHETAHQHRVSSPQEQQEHDYHHRENGLLAGSKDPHYSGWQERAYQHRVSSPQEQQEQDYHHRENGPPAGSKDPRYSGWHETAYQHRVSSPQEQQEQDYHHRAKQQSCDKSDSISVYPTLQELESLASESDYIAFFNCLETRGSIPEIVTEGFKLIRQYVVKDQLARPHGVILSGEGWVKTINTKISAFKHQRDVVLSGLLTLLTLSSLEGNYKKAMVRKGAVDCILSVMDDCRDDGEITQKSCAILELLSRHSKDRLNANFPKIVPVIQKLADVVISADPDGRNMAVCALFNLSSQKKNSEATGKALLLDVRKALVENKSIRAIADVLRSSEGSEKVAEAAMSLLWKISLRHEEDNSADSFDVTEELIDAVIVSMRQFDSPAIAKTATDGEQRLATCAAHVICKLLSNPVRQRAILSSYPQVVKTVLDLMVRFPQSQEILEHGCFAIFHAGRDSQSIQESIMADGAFGIVHRCFQDFVVARIDYPSMCPSMELKDATLCALATLSGCQSGAQKFFDSGLLGDLEALLAVEMNSDFRMILQTIVNNCAATREPTRAMSPDPSDLLRKQPEKVPQLLQEAAASEEKVMLRGLRGLGQDRMHALDDLAFDVVLSTMVQFRNSSEVQAEGCGILADSLTKSNNYNDCSTVYKNGLHVISEAMALHGSNPNVVEHASIVLACIISTKVDSCTIVSVRNKLGNALINVLAMHVESQKVQTVVMDALEACCVRDAYFQQVACNQNTICAIVQSMNLHSGSVELQRSGCSLLRILGGTGYGKASIGQEGGIASTVNALMTHNESPAVLVAGLMALKTLSACSKNNHLIAEASAENAIMYCLLLHSGDSQVVSTAFAALNNIAVDFKTRSVAAVNEEVISMVVDSMKRFRHDELVQKNACFLLKSCSYRSSNLQLILQRGDDLIPLLLAAADEFPRQCDTAAIGIVSKLQECK